MKHISWAHLTDETACDVLARMRTMLGTCDFSGLKADIEKLQIMYSNMESALWDYRAAMSEDDLVQYKKQVKDLKKEIRKAKLEVWQIGKKKDKKPEKPKKLKRK